MRLPEPGEIGQPMLFAQEAAEEGEDELGLPTGLVVPISILTLLRDELRTDRLDGDTLTFGGTFTLVGSADFIIPNGMLRASIGDTAFAMYHGSGVWRVLAFQRAAETSAPAGMIVAYGGQTCPADWVDAVGTAVSRASYPELFAAIGTRWGAGDGSSTFNVPDLRGYFLRMQDAGANRDPNRTLGSAQSDSVGPHQHNVPVANGSAGSGTTNPFTYPAAGGTASVATTGQAPISAGETRPMNIAVWYCVKS